MGGLREISFTGALLCALRLAYVEEGYDGGRQGGEPHRVKLKGLHIEIDHFWWPMPLRKVKEETGK